MALECLISVAANVCHLRLGSRFDGTDRISKSDLVNYSRGHPKLAKLPLQSNMSNSNYSESVKRS